MAAQDDVEEVVRSAGHSHKSGASSQDHDDIERASIQGGDREKCAVKSLELNRTASKASTRLDRVFTTRSIVDPGPPPDGGTKAWIQVACGWLVIFTTWGWVNSYGTFQAYYTNHLDESASTISWIGTIQTWFTFVVGALAGRALDAGFYLPVLIAGSAIQVLGIFLMSISTKYWHLMLTQGVMTGLGGGLFFTPSLGLVATYFSGRRSLAIGLATTGNSVGGAIYPLVVKEMLPRVGFAWTARTLGFINLALLSLVVAFMRPRLPPRTSGPLIDPSAFRERTYALFVTGMFFMMWGVYYTFYYIASFGEEAVGLSYSASTILVIVLNVVGLPARIIPPYFADKIGQMNMFIPCLFCTVIVGYGWLGVHNVGGLYAFTVMYGLANAAFQCLIPSTIASITPRLNMVGTRLGMAFSVFAFAALTGPPLGGAIQTASGGSYTGAQAWAASAGLLGATLVLFSRAAKVGWKVHVRA